ncbi:hypothetical protein [Halostella pelagica]|nr:hypothetical protein [Halostella pelagica]
MPGLGVETALFVADGGDHVVPFRNDWDDDIVDRTAEFLRSNL